MIPRAVALVLIGAFCFPQVSAEPLTTPTAQDISGCVTVDYGPPPYAGIGDCDKFAGMVYVNGTEAGYVP